VTGCSHCIHKCHFLILMSLKRLHGSVYTVIVNFISYIQFVFIMVSSKFSFCARIADPAGKIPVWGMTANVSTNAQNFRTKRQWLQ
jgi:hypothetical protein